MDYLGQLRGEGTAYRFCMKTPKSLKGRVNPWSGKDFGSWIIRGMNGERHRPTAKKLAQLFKAEVIKLEATYRASDRYSPEKAELWNDALRTEEDTVFIRDLIYEEVQKTPREHMMQRLFAAGCSNW